MLTTIINTIVGTKILAGENTPDNYIGTYCSQGRGLFMFVRGKMWNTNKNEIIFSVVDPVIPIQNAVLTISNGTNTYVINPDINGNIEQKVKKGTYKGKCTAPLYDTETIPLFVIKQGSTLVLHIKMKKTI